MTDVRGTYFFLSAAGFFGLRFSLVDLCSLAMGPSGLWLRMNPKLQHFASVHKPNSLDRHGNAQLRLGVG